MKKCDFPIGNGLKLSLNECGSVYFGHVHISIWRSLMPIETLRSGLETVMWDLDYDDFRSDKRALRHFLDVLSEKCGHKVVLFEKSHLGSYAQELEAKGANLDGFLITIFK